MRILQINKFAYQRGGAEIYMLALAQRLARDGHDVGIFGEHRGAVLPGVAHFDLRSPDYHHARGLTALAAGANVLWSRSIAKRLDEILNEFNPDVVHLHNYAHQLSSSIIPVLRRAGVRSVYTAHDYKLVCPAYIRSVNGKDCSACSVRISPKVVRCRCHHGRLGWSSVVAAESVVTRIGRLVPDLLIAPSKYMREALASSWLSSISPVTLLRNPSEPSEMHWSPGGDYLLYVGRLSREKGVMELLKAAHDLGLALKIAGEGPLGAELKEAAFSEGMNVEFLGHISQDRLRDIRVACRAQVIPSEWPENAPLSALEAAASGVPLLMSKRGGLPELLELGVKGALFDHLDAGTLELALDALQHAVGEPEKFGRSTDWADHISALERHYVGNGP
jgi:glycosyltransferase involved in cell wall biosynthesis